ncbi:MAG: type II toxin-antitoxin system VapC family toxin [Dehalococcoidia bacterium]|nr:type II toxin-antitoxin system VapC family toxin [Dehalococcoidia bacterium]
MTVRCVDASLVVAWLIPEQRTPAVVGVWESYASGQDQFIGPPILYAETISAVRRLASRKLLTSDEAMGMVTDILSSGIPVRSPPGLYRRAYELAERHGQTTIYDACYVALAQLLSCEFLTLDKRLYNAMKEAFPHVRLVKS